MTRGAAFKLGLGVTLIVIAVWLWVRPRSIEVAEADAIAKAMAVRYAAGTGQPVSHFGRARRIAWPDGWEFSWIYRPCADATMLRVFVPSAGRGARITEAPDCDASFGVAPIEV